MKAVLEKLDEPRKTAFKSGMPAVVKKLLENKEIWEHGKFFTGARARVRLARVTWRRRA